MLPPLLIPICVVLSLTLLCLGHEQVEDVVAGSVVIDVPAKVEDKLTELVHILIVNSAIYASDSDSVSDFSFGPVMISRLLVRN